jgi:drug/metabolite transporter (DMT)-like permease
MLKPYAAILATITLFSTIEVVTKHIADDVDIFFLAFVRFFAAGVPILALGHRSLLRISRRDLAVMLGIAVIGVPVAFGFFHAGLRTLNASTGAVIFSLNPLFSSLAAVFFIGERLSSRNLVGLLLGFGGAYLVSFGFQPLTFSEAVGPLLMFISAVAFGIYIAAAKRYAGRYGPLTATGLFFTTGSVLLLPLVRGAIHGRLFPTALWIAYLTFAATGLGYVLYFYGLNRLSIAAGTSVYYLKPVIASVLAWAALGEELPVHFLVGLMVILGALSLTRGRAGRDRARQG